MLEAMIFADYSKMNKKTIKWQKLYWMRYGSELDNLPGTYSNSSYGEWAISSIAIYPIEPSVKFVQNCVKVNYIFLNLNSFILIYLKYEGSFFTQFFLFIPGFGLSLK